MFSQHKLTIVLRSMPLCSEICYRYLLKRRLVIKPGGVDCVLQLKLTADAQTVG